MDIFRLVYYALLLSLYAEVSVAALIVLSHQGRGKGGDVSTTKRTTLAPYERKRLTLNE